MTVKMLMADKLVHYELEPEGDAKQRKVREMMHYVKSILPQATRYLWSASTTAMVNKIIDMEDTNNIKKYMSYCKAPSDICWHEFEHVSVAPGYRRDVRRVDKSETKDINRVCFLTITTGSKIKIITVFSANSLRINGGMAFGTPQSTLTINHGDNSIELEAVWGEPAPEDALTALNYLIPHLTLLNCRNLFAEIRDAVIPELWQHRRKRDGKPPLFEHKIITVNLSNTIVQRLRNAGRSDKEIRAHMVRGHFKQRKSGLYWWSPFLRGNAERGIITKSYSIEDSCQRRSEPEHHPDTNTFTTTTQTANAPSF